MGLAEQMVGIKAKTFLMATVFDLAKKYSFLSSKWPEITKEIIHESMKSFSPEEKRREDHTQKFLQWLGFTPVDIGWDGERKVLNIYIGTSRIWREDPRTDEVANVVMKSMISALGANFFEGVYPNVEFLKENLPPRTQFGFRITEGISSDSSSFTFDTVSKPAIESTSSETKEIDTSNLEGPSKSSVLTAKKRIQLFIEPVLGNGLENKEEIVDALFDFVVSLLQEKYADEYRAIIQDIGSYNVLSVLFKKTVLDGSTDDVAKDIGLNFLANKDTDKIEPNDAISGIGKLDVNAIDELLFYTKEKHQDDDFCKFISKIWEGYINKFMPRTFKADEPMCKITSAQMCLFAFNPS